VVEVPEDVRLAPEPPGGALLASEVPLEDLQHDARVAAEVGRSVGGRERTLPEDLHQEVVIDDVARGVHHAPPSACQ
jgi:hypothetical protein